MHRCEISVFINIPKLGKMLTFRASSVKGREPSALYFTTFWVNLELFQNTVFKKPPQNVACWVLAPIRSL